MRILHLEKDCYPSESLQKLEAIAEITYKDFETVEAYHKYLKEHSFEVIYTRLGFAVGAAEMELQPALTHIITPTTGLNHIDLEAAAQKNVRVISLKNEFLFLGRVQSTAEHTWMLLLSVIRNLIPAREEVKNGHWDRVPHLADELNTRTIGIIGLGRLGKILVKYAEAFSMNILCNDLDETVFTKNYQPYQSSLDKLLKEADYVLLQVDYRPENEKFMDTDKFARMKKGAYFINTSRGEMVDEEALLETLQSGHLRGAAVDVLAGDSSWDHHTGESPLLNYARHNNNLLITPHMGGYGKRSIEMTRAFVTDKFLKTLDL